ncbi:hypothetical protein L6164_006168 [Bauhinia variegata]|uniref:Uncharacterized protein n=1 Tax=Bauhinia variegata TaxID=167791 RepID=A0ACB9PTH4_BAUVA|nr:hypothetical protein L6164_006168 [Bauhinia variegata]
MGFLESYSESVFAAATLATTTLAFLIIKTHFRRFSGKGRPHVVAGTALNMMLNYHRLYDYLADLARKHKTFRILSFLRSDVCTADPVNVEYILKTNFLNYGKGWYHYSILKDLLGDGIFTVDGDKWRHQRKTSSYEISTKIDLLLKSTLDTVFKVVLGVELDTMYGTYEEGTKFSRAFDAASEITMYRYIDIFWKIKRLLNIGSEAELKKSIKVIDEFVNKIIKNKIEQAETTPNDLPMRKGDLISRFLELKETDPKYLTDIIFSFMIAGRDTTATTLSWFLYMLCKHPHLQERIAVEVKHKMKLKNDSTIDEVAASITAETLERMHYLHATLTETLRLYPVLPTDGKTCLTDDTLPDGFNVRKGDLVAYQPYAMGRMKCIWGDDPEEFRPERWLDKDGRFQQESPFKFTAFQAGPRICLGKDFAYRQMKIFAAVLLYGYNFKLADPKKPVNYRIMLTLFVKEGLHLQASKRSWPFEFIDT